MNHRISGFDAAPIETALASLECRDESRELDACVARKVPASLSLVHRLFHEANLCNRCRLRQSIDRVSVFLLDIEEKFHGLIAESV